MFPHNDEGNLEAEEHFKSIVKIHDSEVTDEEMEILVEDGFHEQGDYQLFLTHSGVASKHPKYVLLEGIEERNRFFSPHNPNRDETKLDDGTVAYNILGYTNTIEEAQMELYGRSFVNT